MRIIHCADLHLDAKMTANLSKEQARERRAELLHTFERMLEYANHHEVEAILVAGDMFDTKNISATARNVVYRAIEQNPQITFYYLKGNHDSDNFLSGLNEMPENLKLFSDTWTSYSLKEGACGRITLSGVELNRDNSGSIYPSLVLDKDDVNIVMLHGQEAGYATIDKAENINLKELRNRGIDYLALGHIHAYKEAELDRRGIYCYPGCLEGRGFDECGEHGFVLLDIDEQTGKITHQLIPIAYRNCYTLQVDVTGCMHTTEIAQILKDKLDEAGYDGKSLVKIVLVGEVDVECEKNIEYLVKKVEPDFYFVKIYDETGLKVDDKSYALDESLKGEFVRTVMASDIEEAEKAAIIRYGIMALAGEEIS